MIHKARILLIELGKVSPFIVCFIVLISYIESIYAILFDKFVLYDDYYVLNKPISWFLGTYFEYNLTTIVILLVISISTETCKWNKISIFYLLSQLMIKNYIQDFELDIAFVYTIIVVNIIICCFLCYKGFKMKILK